MHNAVVAEGPREAAGPDILNGVKDRRKHQAELKYCERTILPKLWKHPEAWPFRQPVDPVALQLPDYFSIVTHPMDLSTVKSKLARLEYTTADECFHDIQMIFNNCRLYNQPGTDVMAMCDALEREYTSLLRSMHSAGGEPAQDTPAESSVGSDGTAGLGRTKRALNGHAAVKKKSVGGGRASKKKQGSTHRSDGTAATAAAPNNEHKPMVASNNMTATQLTACKSIMRMLFSKQHSTYARPFYKPVDVVGLGLDDYLDIVKTPMDMGTVRERLERGDYANPGAFASDLRLMFSNCYRYNIPKSDVFQAGRKLQDVFEAAYAKLCVSHAGENDDVDSGDQGSEGEGSLGKRTVTAKGHHGNGHTTAAASESRRKTSTTSQSSLSTSKKDAMAGPKRKAGQAQASKTKKSKYSDSQRANQQPDHSRIPKRCHGLPSSSYYQPMSFKEKRRLSSAINCLPPDKIPPLVNIIQDRIPPLKQCPAEELEIDIDSLDPLTLRLLDNYVRKVGVNRASGLVDESTDESSPSAGRPMEDVERTPPRGQSSSDRCESSGSDDDGSDSES